MCDPPPGGACCGGVWPPVWYSCVALCFVVSRCVALRCGVFSCVVLCVVVVRLPPPWWSLLRWCLAMVMVGRAALGCGVLCCVALCVVVVSGPPHGGACCGGACPPHGGACVVGFCWPVVFVCGVVAAGPGQAGRPPAHVWCTTSRRRINFSCIDRNAPLSISCIGASPAKRINGTNSSTAELQSISLRVQLKVQRSPIPVDKTQKNFELPRRCVPRRDICRETTKWSSHHVRRHNWLRDTRTSPC